MSWFRSHRASANETPWWRSAMFDCLPASIRRRLQSRITPFRLELGAQWARLVRNGQQLAKVGLEENGLDPATRTLLAAHEYPLVLVLPGTWVLERHLSLPIAAAENLRKVLEYELDRLTPFSAEQVYLDFRKEGLSEEGGTIGVRLVLVPRQRVDDWLDLLRAAGIPVDGIQVDGFWEGINLLPPEQRPRPSVKRILWRSLPAVLVVALVIASLALPLWQKRKITMELQAREAMLRNKADKVLMLRQRLESKTRDVLHVREQWQSAPPVLDILSLLTNLLPDHTYLQQMNIKGNELTIRGLSGQASSLIALLENSPAFEEPRFLSPVTQQRGKELFHLSARIRQPFPREALDLAVATIPSEKPGSEGAAGKSDKGNEAEKKESKPVVLDEGKSSTAGWKGRVHSPRVGKEPVARPPSAAEMPGYLPEPEPVVQRILSGGG